MPTVLLFALALLACSKPDLASPADEPVATEESGGLASQMLAEVNALRETGCRCGTRWMPPAPALSWNTQLANAARRHAGDMQRNDFFNHRGSD
ncbi:MAG: CAP domain-containing protein, partial [Phaeodactylibacter sp.]|nr:CAP domain-containing protein [Phaeodactylibacter sp.]